MRHNNGAVYAIIDNKADMIVSTVLTIHKHPAAAMRFFDDIARSPQSDIAKHPADYDLVQLGYLTEDNQIVAEHDVILTGKQWLSMQQPTEPQLVKEA